MPKKRTTQKQTTEKEDFVPEPDKVELGSRDKSDEGFRHVDLRTADGLQIATLPFETGSVSEFYSCFAWENLDRDGAGNLLCDIFRCLKSGGKVGLVLHNLHWAAQAIAIHPDWVGSITVELYGKQDHEENYRHWAYTPDSIVLALKDAGFEKVEILNPGTEHSMHVVATK